MLEWSRLSKALEYLARSMCDGLSWKLMDTGVKRYALDDRYSVTFWRDNPAFEPGGEERPVQYLEVSFSYLTNQQLTIKEISRIWYDEIYAALYGKPQKKKARASEETRALLAQHPEWGEVSY